MTIEELKILAKEGEGYTLEFKENIGKKFAVEVVAFANSMGGKILIGVDDNGNLVGTDTSNNQRANIQNQISQIEPRINVKIDIVDNIIVVNVPEGDDKPYCSSEGYFLRAGAMCQKMNRNEIREYLEDSGKIQFGRMINKKAKYPEDFDEETYNKFLKLSNITEILKKEELLVNLNCLEKVNDKYMFTNAGVIFFAKTPKRYLIQNYITCISFKGTNRVYILDTLDCEKDIITNIEDALSFAKKHINLTYLINAEVMKEQGNATRKEVLEIPEEALKEAIINGICHRLYTEEGARVMIEIYDDRVSIVSPGGIPKGITQENFGKRSIARNPVIADLLRRTHYIEKAGTGIGRMKELMDKAGLREPQFKYDDFFEVNFLRPSYYDKDYGTYDLSKKKESIKERLNKTQVRILELIKENASITQREMAQIIGLAMPTIRKNIGILKKKNIISRIGSTKKGKWIING